MMKQFGGICAALLTPYNADGSVNYKLLKRHVRWLIERGIDGFYVSGSSAEAFLLQPDERKALLEAVIEENAGEKFVIAHVGQIATEAAIDLARHARAAGADALSSISPFYYKFTNEEIKRYYFDIIDAADMRMFIYNFPAFSGFSLTPELLDELCVNPKVAGVKFTCSDLYQLERMKAAHKELVFWNGYDEILLAGLNAGADGGIGSTYNVLCPAIRRIYDCFRAGDGDGARKYQHIVNDIISVIGKYGVFASCKTLLSFEGMDFGGCRKPFLPVSAEGVSALRAAYDKFKAAL